MIAPDLQKEPVNPNVLPGCLDTIAPKIRDFDSYLSDTIELHPEAFKVNRVEKFQKYVRYMRDNHIEAFTFVKDRHKEYVRLRHAFYYICSCADNPKLMTKCKNITLANIGEVFGQDHSMVIYARDLITDLKETKQAEPYMTVMVGLINSLIKE